MSRPPVLTGGWSFQPWPPAPEPRRGYLGVFTLRELDRLQALRRAIQAGTRNEQGTAAQRRLAWARWCYQRGLYAS